MTIKEILKQFDEEFPRPLKYQRKELKKIKDEDGNWTGFREDSVMIECGEEVKTFWLNTIKELVKELEPEECDREESYKKAIRDTSKMYSLGHDDGYNACREDYLNKVKELGL